MKNDHSVTWELLLLGGKLFAVSALLAGAILYLIR